MSIFGPLLSGPAPQVGSVVYPPVPCAVPSPYAPPNAHTFWPPAPVVQLSTHDVELIARLTDAINRLARALEAK